MHEKIYNRFEEEREGERVWERERDITSMALSPWNPFVTNFSPMQNSFKVKTMNEYYYRYQQTSKCTSITCTGSFTIANSFYTK
jgi:hypothetical protein